MKKILLGLVLVSNLACASWWVPDASIDTAQLKDGSVTTGKLANGAITPGVLPAVNTASSSSSGTANTSSGSYSDVTNLSVSITSTGRPVLITMEAAGSSGNYGVVYITVGSGSPIGLGGILKFVRDSTDMPEMELVSGSTLAPEVSAPCSAFSYVDNAPSAASHTYKVQYKAGSNTQVGVNNCKLTVREL